MPAVPMSITLGSFIKVSSDLVFLTNHAAKVGKGSFTSILRRYSLNIVKIMLTTQIIGVQKAGTTSLYNWLGQHPEILAPKLAKDIHVFDQQGEYQSLVDQFLTDYYKGQDSAKEKLHCAVNYCMSPEALKRIHQYNPNSKIIIVLRDPIDRLISSYNYFRTLGIEKRTLPKAIDDELSHNISPQHEHFASYMRHGEYATIIKSIYEIFSPSNVLICLFEEVISNTKAEIARLCNFLRIDESYSFDTRQKFNKTSKVYSPFIHSLLNSSSTIVAPLKRLLHIFTSQKSRIRMGNKIRQLNSRSENVEKVTLSEEYMNICRTYFESEMRALGAYIDPVRLKVWNTYIDV